MLFLKGYTQLILLKDPMGAVASFNSSLNLNPCANCDDETHFKLMLAIREAHIYGPNDWSQFAVLVKRDFGEEGKRICVQDQRAHKILADNAPLNTYRLLSAIAENFNSDMVWEYLIKAHNFDIAIAVHLLRDSLPNQHQRVLDAVKHSFRADSPPPFADNKPSNTATPFFW